jgi:hypothetical protein
VALSSLNLAPRWARSAFRQQLQLGLSGSESRGQLCRRHRPTPDFAALNPG